MEITLTRDIAEVGTTKFPITRKPKVLLVEDAPILQRVHVRFLEFLGCSVVLARHAADVFQNYTDDYDLILMDIGLPDINGLEVSAAIRSRPASKHIPIIALTAYGDIAENDCKWAGIDAVAVKPISMEELSVLLKQWLALAVTAETA